MNIEMLENKGRLDKTNYVLKSSVRLMALFCETCGIVCETRPMALFVRLD